MTIGVDASRAFAQKRTGTENYTWQLLLALAKLECQHKFRLYTKGQLSAHCFEKTRSASDLKISDRKQVPRVAGFATRSINWLRFWTQGGLAIETWRRPVDLLFIPAHVIPFLKNPKVPIVVTVHDLGFEFLPWYQNPVQRFYLSKVVEKLRAHLAAHIIAVSKATKKDLIKKLGVPEEKISVVYEGVDRRRFAPQIASGLSQIAKTKKKYGIHEEYILFVGTIQPRKNLVRLIEAFARLPSDFSAANSLTRRVEEFKPDGFSLGGASEFQLVLVGKRGWSAEEIYQAPKRFGVAEKVKFLDYIDDFDLPALYAGASCFCLPSLHEGFGLPVLEAIASGTPVVISNTSSLPEVGGDAAIYVNPYNVDSIAEGLKQVLSNVRLRQRLVEKGLKQVERFSWEKCAKETIQVLEKVISKK